LGKKYSAKCDSILFWNPCHERENKNKILFCQQTPKFRKMKLTIQILVSFEVLDEPENKSYQIIV